MYALEREVNDLQSEFQLDRADYLETIRRLEKNCQFYKQFVDLALPYLRKSGRYWDPEAIKCESTWNDDLNKWKLPEDSMIRLKLPPAGKHSLHEHQRTQNGANLSFYLVRNFRSKAK